MMTRNICKALAASLLLASPALAAMGVNPADPALPRVSKTGVFNSATTPIARNQLSAMCMDCHTAIPKPSMGTHYSSATASATHSGGSGNLGTDGAISTRDASQYFKLDGWSTASYGANLGFSKYGDSANVLSKSVQNTNSPAATAEASGPSYDAYELICESCHNIIVNDAGGNNLLDVNDDGTNIDWVDVPESTLCTGCHGFMYTSSGSNPSSGTNYASTKNNDRSGAKRDNNEQHWVYNGTQQAAYRQNHHVMTTDPINGTVAGAGLLWTDNLIVSYTETAISNVSTQGTYPVGAAWTGSVTKSATAGNLNCTSCHAPGHGGDITEGASILRGTGLNGAATTAIQRISDRNAWKRFNDMAFCGQCHK